MPKYLRKRSFKRLRKRKRDEDTNKGNKSISQLTDDCLHAACRQNDSTEVISKIVDIGGKELVIKKFNGEYTVLYTVICCCHTRIEVISKLVEVAGRELVMEERSDGNTVLHTACKNKKIQLKSCLNL